MKNDKYALNAVVFSKEDLISKTCNIYKFNLTKEQKLKHFKEHFKEDYDEKGNLCTNLFNIPNLVMSLFNKNIRS